MQLSSPAFVPNTAIPDTYTCKGENTCPPLAIAAVPANTQSLALIMHDPDAVHGDFTHWLLWNIPIQLTEIPEHCTPMGATVGTNDMGKAEYAGPCPPRGTGVHHYTFELYALRTPLDLPESTDRAGLEAAMQGHIAAHAQLVGLYSAEA